MGEVDDHGAVFFMDEDADGNDDLLTNVVKHWIKLAKPYASHLCYHIFEKNCNSSVVISASTCCFLLKPIGLLSWKGLQDTYTNSKRILI